MLPKADEPVTELSKYLARIKDGEATQILSKDKQEEPPVKKETPKNDDYNEYDVSDDPEQDDRNW